MITNSSLALLFSSLLGPTISDQMHRSAVTLALLRKTTGGGPNASWGVSGGANDAATYNDAQDIEDGSSDSRVKAVVSWSIYGGPVFVGDLAAAVAQSTPAGLAPEQVTGPFALFLDEIRSRTEKIAELLNKHILTGTGTFSGKPAIVGLNAIAREDTAFAGIDQDEYDWWEGIEDTSTDPRAITAELVQKFFTKFMKKGSGRGKKPTYLILEPDLWGALKKDIENNKKTIITLFYQVPVGGANVTLPAGSSAFSLDGVMCVMDPDAPADVALAFCADDVELLQLPGAAQLSGASVDNVVQEVMGNVPVNMQNFGVDPVATGRLMPYVEFLAKTGLSQKAFVGVNVALKVRSRKSVGALRNLTA